MLYSRGRTHLRVFHSKDLISSEQQQTFQDQNSVEEHLKTVRVSTKLIDPHVHLVKTGRPRCTELPRQSPDKRRSLALLRNRITNSNYVYFFELSLVFYCFGKSL